MRKGKEGVADCMMGGRGSDKQRASEQPVMAGITDRAGLAFSDRLRLKTSNTKVITQLSGGVSA